MINIKFRKVLNDLIVNFSKTLLVIFALAIGLWGAGSILISYTILQNDLNQNFIRTSPPHAILTSKDFTQLNIKTFKEMPEIESAEFRDLSFQRIEVYPNQWIPVWLFGVENFNNFKIARIYHEQGTKIPQDGTMLIERNGQLVSNLRIGSNAKIRVDNRTLSLPISGICFDPAQAPATQDAFIYAYTNKKTFTEVSRETPNHRLIVRFKNVKTKQDIETLADKILTDFKSQGIIITSINIPKINEHPHQWQLNTLLLLEGSIGFLALLMAAVLVSQLMAAILASEVRQIGILKAIGASKFNIFQIYGSMILFFGITAGIIAIPLSLYTGFAFARFVAGILNFDILTTTLPVYVYILLILTSLILPIVVSFPTLLKGVSVSVKDAISDYGIKENVINNKTKKTTITSLPYSLVLAVRNTMRQKKRLLITVITMALGVAIFSTGFNIRSALKVLLTDVKDGMKHDVQVVLSNQISKEEALLPFRKINNISKIETWNGGRGELQSKTIATTDGVGIIALPYNTDLIKLRLLYGRWLNSSTAPEVVMNQQAVSIYKGLTIGSNKILYIAGKYLKVKLVGIVEEFEKPKIYMDINQYDSFANPNHYVNSIMFIAKNNDFEKVVTLKKDIEKAINSSSLHVFYVMSQAERVKIIYDHLNIILTTIVFLALLVLIVSAMGMSSATSINIMERTREIGILRAIGATPAQIYKLFVNEGMVISLASIILGLLLAWPLSIIASSFFGELMLGDGASLRFSFSYNGLWITLTTTIIFCWLASRIPAQKAINVSAHQALSY